MSENSPKQITTYNSNIEMSENTPKEITRYNSNIKMSKNNSKNKNINYNIVYSNMTSKTVKSNIEILKAITKDVKNPDLKRKAEKLFKNYSERINEILIEQKKEKRQTKASNKIQHFMRNSLTFTTRVTDKAMKNI